MPHIHTNPGEHDITASGYVVRLDTPEPSVMLHWHRKLGVWLQYGGHIEVLDNPWKTVKNELRQESGYDLRQLSLYQPDNRIKQLTNVILHPVPLVMNTHPFGLGIDHYHTDIAYAFATTEKPRYAIAAGESNTISLQTLDGLRALPEAEIFPNVREIGIFILENVVDKWQQVPASDFVA